VYNDTQSPMSFLPTNAAAKLIQTTTTARTRRPWTLVKPSPHRKYYRQAPEPPSVELAELLSRYISIAPPRPLNLSTLLSFGRPLTPQSVLASVEYVLSEVPRRLATRVRSLEALPFIVGTNPYVAKTLNAYRESFRWFATHPPVTTLAENAQFAQDLEDIVQTHSNDIPTMAKG